MKVETMREIMPGSWTNSFGKTGPIVINCSRISVKKLIETLRIKCLNGNSSEYVVLKAPSYGEYRKMILEDLSILTDANFINSWFCIRLNDLQFRFRNR